ncbi:Glycerol-3-phosphate acyltransferase 1 [Triticum urartu]|uniref:Glycerol-3-phosphate acyltransferase 1 n=1 Tax=Triticum urartu TaxID=4572 RepID=M7Z1A8_TRIUA|nr:Glycerol-3-phosphate acyltransferase 1 [Triticum urartu]
MAMSTGDGVVHRMLNLHRVVKSNLVAGLLRGAAASRSFPTVMVEAFLKDYVGFDAVIGMEVKAGHGYFAGVMDGGETGASGGRFYACNHRTLLDPIAISSALGKPVFAVTYSLSPLSELLSPIPLLRLTRGRDEDRRRMSSLLERGDVVVCPEGTTCREPYLLRFSPLFAELADEVSPVAVDERSTMFYGTSTSPGAKCLDSVFFLMNPRPEYSVHFLEPVRTDNPRGSIEVANQVQGVLAGALGFTPTALTRKDKYLLLAGNEGVVSTKTSKVI